MLSASLRRARERSGISRELLSALSEVPTSRIEAWETGESEPSPTDADSAARAFGVRLRDLEGQGGWPLERLLFRAHDKAGLLTLAETGSWPAIGEFLRAIADLADIERVLGVTEPPPLPVLASPGANQSPWEGAQALARSLRRALRLDASSPIPSMRLLVAELGVQLFFTTPDELDRNVDGASTRLPRPAILVNLIEGPGSWWRTRMTIAHELCHLLVDHTEGSEAFVSAANPTATSHVLFDGYGDLERRANAFAACLLAPSEAVRQHLTRLDPTSEEAIASIASHFGLGRITAINRIRDVFDLSVSTRASMLARRERPWDSGPHDDFAEDVGIRAGVLRDRVLEALSLGRIDSVRARELLALPLTEPLPAAPGIDAALLAPLRPKGDRARRAAQRYLVESENRADLVAGAAQRVEGGWLVPVEGEGKERSIRVSFDMDVETPGE